MKVLSLDELPTASVPATLYSYCLFESDQLRDEKHIQPFLTHLKNHPTMAAQTILFATEHFEFLAPHVGFFVPVPQLDGYANHLDRYRAAYTQAYHVICLGTDEPKPYPDFCRCMDIAQTFNFNFVGAFMESHPENLIGGRIYLGPRKFNSTREYFCNELTRALVNPINFGWNCDQEFISGFVEGYDPPAVFNAPAGVFKAATLDFLKSRLLYTPTIIVREPNRYFQ